MEFVISYFNSKYIDEAILLKFEAQLGTNISSTINLTTHEEITKKYVINTFRIMQNFL